MIATRRLPLTLVAGQVPAKIFNRDSDRGQRGAEVVAERREQGGCEIGFLPCESGGVPLGHELRAFDRDRHDPGDRVEGADVEGWRRGQQADGPGPVPQRHDRESIGSTNAHVAAVGALVRVELERAAGTRDRGIQHIDVDPHLLTAALVYLPVVLDREADGDAGELESPGDMSRERIESAGGFGRQQHVPGQIEQPGYLVATGDGLSAPVAAPRRTGCCRRWQRSRKTASATQFCGSAIVNVPTGGRKKKFNGSIAAIDTTIATHGRAMVAEARTTRSRARATVVGLTSGRARSTAVSARIARRLPRRATASRVRTGSVMSVDPILTPVPASTRRGRRSAVRKS